MSSMGSLTSTAGEGRERVQRGVGECEEWAVQRVCERKCDGRDSHGRVRRPSVVSSL